MPDAEMQQLIRIYKALQDLGIVYLYRTQHELQPWLEKLHSPVYVQQKLEQYRNHQDYELEAMMEHLEKDRYRLYHSVPLTQ